MKLFPPQYLELDLPNINAVFVKDNLVFKIEGVLLQVIDLDLLLQSAVYFLLQSLITNQQSKPDSDCLNLLCCKIKQITSALIDE